MREWRCAGAAADAHAPSARLAYAMWLAYAIWLAYAVWCAHARMRRRLEHETGQLENPSPSPVRFVQFKRTRGAYSAPPPAWRGHGRGSCNTCIKRGRGQTKAWPCVHAAAGVPVQFAAVRGVRPPRVLPVQGKTMRPCPNSGRVVGAGAV